MQLTPEELAKRFAFHAPRNVSVKLSHETVRSLVLQCTTTVLQQIPADSREASVFVTKMEEAMFWANAAIARNQP